MRIQQDHGDHRPLLRSGSSGSDSDLEAQQRRLPKETRDLDRRRSFRKISLPRRSSITNVSNRVTEKVQPEWALILIGCLLGITTGLCVVAFNRGEKIIHDWAWAGTPHEGAAWLRLQRLADTWHRIMLIPVTGGVIVGVMHAVLAIIDQIKASGQHERQRFDVLGGVCPVIKAAQAAVTLGTGCSLGPEGPSVDIGKSLAFGYAHITNSNRQRKIALVAAGAAAGISSGFNAAVSGCFFAIETVLRPLHAENSPPLTTAMIILASVLATTVSNSILGERPAFTVPAYELRSAAELPLYLVLGMICGVVGVIFTRLVDWFTRVFNFLKERLGIPMTVTPALGGLGVGIIALRYPGVLYWGFTNVEEILQTGKTVSAPGKWLLTQLILAKVVATALCKGSGLVGGLYAPSLMMGSAVGAVFGDLAGRAINAAIPGHAAVAHPQAYALVGMACFLASVCSVPLTSVLLLFELTKDYHILLPLMGAVGLAFWVAALENQRRSGQHSASANIQHRSFSSDSLLSGGEQRVWVMKSDEQEVELCRIDGPLLPGMVAEEELLDELKVGQAMLRTYAKVQATATVKEAVQTMLDVGQSCVLVVDEDDLLEGIFSISDLQREVFRAAMATSQGDPTMLDVNSTLVAAICTGNFTCCDNDREIVVCYPDMSLRVAQRILETQHLRLLPVVSRGGRRWQDRGRKLCGILTAEDIPIILRKEATKRVVAFMKRDDDDEPNFAH
ncbi:hypothetical protein KP509_04G050000 [Ceratopteris richardii]|uniref:Chloride channel protein n=1 Tax=Ceratopteris richardii TaxID=49495 RepID=A0A8T2V0C4_CERRI|nr:hypothetical protein KP509_04G050000 [Ceratopteris richardii]KAH7439204.1 hypothetical protein KP509_04G050000 [Ceratopteris richardii]